MSDSEPIVRPPRWVRAAWFIGRPPPLTQRQWLMLGLVSAVSFFETYDMFLFSLNLKQIQASLAIPEESVGTLGSVVRIGAVLALLILPFADRFGRRRVLLGTVIGYTLMTALTALAPNAESFVVLQFFARIFAVAETLLAAVVIVEEFPAAHRGWGIGAAAAIQSCGGGFAALMFMGVDIWPFGWRALYAVGVIPLCFIAYWRRALPETRRFANLEQHRPQLEGVPLFANVLRAAREYPRSFWLLVGVFFSLSLASSPAGFFASKYLQDVHHWSPAQVGALTVGGGAFAIIGFPLAGWLSDRFGRRSTGSLFMLGYGLAMLAFYSLTGFLIPPMWILYNFFSMGSSVTMNAYSAELFPTSMRSSASGATSLAGPLGGVVGLAAVSALFGIAGGTWNAILLVAAFALLLPPVVYLMFPETARRELDEITSDVLPEAPPDR